MKLKHLPLVGALTVAAPAFAITVNMTDFSFPVVADVSVVDTFNNINYDGAAGRFYGTATDDGTPAAAAARSATSAANFSSTSFVAYCAELTQSFNFNVNYTDYAWVGGGSYFTAQKATDLSRLFTATSNFVVDGATSAAVQAAIWEIIYQQGTSYDLTSGNFQITTTGDAYLAAFSTVNMLLGNLSQYSAGYHIDVLVSPTAQNFVVGSIPEPGTWALLIAGLGVMGLVARRSKR